MGDRRKANFCFTLLANERSASSMLPIEPADDRVGQRSCFLILRPTIESSKKIISKYKIHYGSINSSLM